MCYTKPFEEMIEWFDQILGVQPVPRCEEGIECDMRYGKLNIRFASGPEKPSEDAISHVIKYAAGRGYTITRPERDDDVVFEVSLSIDDIHRDINRIIDRARVQARIRRQGYRLRAEKLRDEYIQTRDRGEFDTPPIVDPIERMRVRYPEWYNAIRQLNEDALETDRLWWEEKGEETLVVQWDCKVIMWALDDMHRREKA